MCSHLCPCVIGSAVSHANDPTPLLLEFFLALAFPGPASGVARPAPCPQVSWVWAEHVVVDAEFQVHQKISVSHFLRFFFEDWLCWLTNHCRGAFYLEFDIYQPRYDIPKTCTDSKVYLDRFSAFWKAKIRCTKGYLEFIQNFYIRHMVKGTSEILHVKIIRCLWNHQICTDH